MKTYKTQAVAKQQASVKTKKTGVVHTPVQHGDEWMALTNEELTAFVAALEAEKAAAAELAQKEADEAQKNAEAANTAMADIAAAPDNILAEATGKRPYLWTVYTQPHYWQVPLLDGLKAHASANYDNGMGWDIMCETMKDMDVIAIVGRATTVKSYINRMEAHLKTVTDYAKEITNA